MPAFQCDYTTHGHGGYYLRAPIEQPDRHPPMPESSTATKLTARLVIVLNSVRADTPELGSIPLRYAVTAAAMDVAVEIHAVNESVRLFRRQQEAPDWLAQVRQAVDLGVEIFVCPVALADQALGMEDLIDEVSGVRGAASLVVAGLGPGARFMVF